jgi:sulfite exporter TauE/SafE/copper chaperone CopZ/plastocyanin domain-containing protein
MKTVDLAVGGMTCAACQNRIETALRNTAGVQNASVDYVKGKAVIRFEPSAVSLDEIKQIIEKLGYEVLEKVQGSSPQGKTALQIAGILIIILALSALLRMFSTSGAASAFPVAAQGMGYAMVLIIGLLTGVHCIAMCGGINLSQTLNRGTENTNTFSRLTPSILYNAGRIVSYTAIGAAVGALGSVFNVSQNFRAAVLLVAGLLMTLMGINMLGLFPFLKRITPRLPGFLTNKTAGQKFAKGPFIVGILNGFMPCGPLQAMQLYALSTASALAGGFSMFLFSAGTVPLMFALGAAGGLLGSGKGREVSKRVMQAGSVIIAAMGIVMFTNGWNSAAFPSLNSFSSAPRLAEGEQFSPNIIDGVQIVNSVLQGGRYPAITVQQGIPVKWVINAPRSSINGCNNRMFIREYGIEHTFTPGENVIEFFPEKTGRFRYSCWMSMIHSSITVLAPGESLAAFKEPDITPVPAGIAIRVDSVAVAQIIDYYQVVEINLTDEGFDPAVIVVQRNIPVLWTINNNSLDPGNNTLVFPEFITVLDIRQGENVLQLYPDADFDFSTGDNIYYGYVKVVNDLKNIDLDTVKTEVLNHETLIYPPAYFEQMSSAGCACCL